MLSRLLLLKITAKHSESFLPLVKIFLKHKQRRYLPDAVFGVEFLLFWGHTSPCSGFAPDFPLRDHSCWDSGTTWGARD